MGCWRLVCGFSTLLSFLPLYRLLVSKPLALRTKDGSPRWQGLLSEFRDWVPSATPKTQASLHPRASECLSLAWGLPALLSGGLACLKALLLLLVPPVHVRSVGEPRGVLAEWWSPVTYQACPLSPGPRLLGCFISWCCGQCWEPPWWVLSLGGTGLQRHVWL